MSVVVNQLSKSYGKQKALDSISFEINRSGIVGLLGPNGAGKSTLMKIIVGYLFADSGEVSIDGLTNKAVDKEYRAMIGYLPENNPLYYEMFVKEYLRFVANINNLKGDVNGLIDSVIEQVGLQKEVKKQIGELSKGYKQRVGLAAALLPNPKVLILDEPTTGLDPLQIVEIRDLIKEVSKEKIVILSTHIMQEVQALCNRILIIKDGKIVADEDSANLTNLLKNKKAEITVEFDRTVDSSIFKSLKNLVSSDRITDKTYLFITEGDVDIRADLFKLAVDNHLVILSSNRKEISMEAIFQELAG